MHIEMIDSFITITSAFCFISAFLTYGLGVFVFSQKPSSTAYRLFFAAMLSSAYWAAGEFFIWQADSLQGAEFWLKFSSFWPLTMAFSTHFILEFTKKMPFDGKRRSIFLAFCIYIPAILLSIIGLFTECLFSISYISDFGYAYIPSLNHPICPLEVIYSLLIMSFALYTAFISYKEAKTSQKKKQNLLIFTGTSAAIFFGALSGVFLPRFEIYGPNLVFIGLVIFSVTISYAIQRYGLFILTPESAVPEIMKTIPEGLLLADNNGMIVAANESAKKIFSLSDSSPEGRTIRSLIPENDYSAIRENISEHGKISDFEVSLTGEGPEYISISGSAVKSKNDAPEGTVLIIRDITARKASENAIRIANDKLFMLSRLTRHDISNLVTALSGYLSLLDKRVQNTEEKHYLSQATVIVNNIMKHLEFSRSYQDIGSKKPQWKPLEDLINSARGNLIQENIDIRIKIAPVEIYADPFLERVMYNLLENAVRHGEKITWIKISTEEQKNGSMTLKFEDDGIGIPEEEKEMIFSYGYGRNTGFGLAFARELLSVTGIEITERGVFGEGASFEIEIPAKAWRKA